MKIYLSDNLRLLREAKKLTQKEIADALHIKKTTYGNYETGFSNPDFLVLKEMADFFALSADQLLYTQPEKLPQPGSSLSIPVIPARAAGEKQVSAESYRGIPHVVTVDNSGEDNIIHVPIKARAGYLLGYGDPEYISSLYTYRLPGLRHGTYRSFEVEGQSMKPTLLTRDWCVGEWVESLDQIRENRVHIVVTRQEGILIKRVLNRISERGKLYLKSDSIYNKHEYPTIEIDPSEVAEIWYARLKFSADFSEPNDFYNRMDNVELELIDLKKQVETLKSGKPA